MKHFSIACKDTEYQQGCHHKQTSPLHHHFVAAAGFFSVKDGRTMFLLIASLTYFSGPKLSAS